MTCITKAIEQFYDKSCISRNHFTLPSYSLLMCSETKYKQPLMRDYDRAKLRKDVINMCRAAKVAFERFRCFGRSYYGLIPNNLLYRHI